MIGGIWKNFEGDGRGTIAVLSGNLPGVTGKSNEEPQSRWRASTEIRIQTLEARALCLANSWEMRLPYEQYVHLPSHNFRLRLRLVTPKYVASCPRTEAVMHTLLNSIARLRTVAKWPCHGFAQCLETLEMINNTKIPFMFFIPTENRNSAKHIYYLCP
jgi:hypothetical protein